jgi:ERCC4-type nuclease
MILVDRRIGSADLVNYLPKSLASLDTLDYGDAAFIGYGKDGVPVRIGIEIKTIGDACASIRSGRFAGHQLPGLLSNYDRSYLILEGEFRLGPEGTMQTRSRGSWHKAQWGYDAWMYREIDSWMNTITNVTGIIIKRTLSRRESAAVIHNLYRWWTEKGYDKHRSHVGFDTSGSPQLCKASNLRTLLAAIPGIGWVRSGAAEAYFKDKSPHEICHADAAAWSSIEGIGKVIARRVVAFLNGAQCND